MQIPKKIKVGGHTLKIIMKDFADVNLCGETDLDKNTIQIRKSLHQSQKESTFFHELFHVMNWAIEDEEKVELWAQAIYQVLHDNKLLK